MIYYVQLEGNNIKHAVTYPINGYIKLDSGSSPLPSCLTDEYKWDGTQYVYSTTFADSGFNSYLQSFVDSEKLTFEDLYEMIKVMYNDFNTYKNIKINVLSKQCNKTILAGFDSTAFDGITSKHYDSEMTDQARISGLVSVAQLRLSNLSDEILKWKATGELECYVWSPESILKLGLDMKKHIEYNTDKFNELRKFVLNASTVDAVNLVSW